MIEADHRPVVTDADHRPVAIDADHRPAAADAVRQSVYDRVVFLDIDGVLNSHERPALHHGLFGIDPIAVSRLNRLLAATGASIVVSSTWRLRRMRTELAELLASHGVIGRVIGKTPSLLDSTRSGGGAARGVEIQAWLDAQSERRRPRSFVILDDDSDMVHLAHRLVKTSLDVGLTDADVNRAILMLSEAP